MTLQHGMFTGSLPGKHADSLDRRLAAQAEVEGSPLVTADPVFKTVGVQILW